MDKPGSVAVAVLALSIFLISFPVVLSAANSSSVRGSTSATDDGLCSSVIRPLGYTCSEHTVRTKDGFLLGLQRVSPDNGNLERKRGPPVLLLHGLFMGGEAWFLNSVNDSLGFLLADQGFDVWVGNIRGIEWSHGHVTLSKSDKGFWDWSWQELANIDLPTMLNYVNHITNSKVFVVGHSQGTLMSLAGFTNQELAKKVEAAALLCPIAHLSHVRAPLLRLMVLLHIDDIAMAEGINSIDFRSEYGTETINMLCHRDVDCHHLLNSITGENCCFDKSKTNYLLRFDPQPTSTKNLHHLCQLVRSGYFSQYDYGLDNIRKYRRFNPPAYNISVIPASLPLWIAYGGNDGLSVRSDVEQALHELQQVKRETTTLYLEDYGHMDFLLSSTAKVDVYDNLISFLKNHTH